MNYKKRAQRLRHKRPHHSDRVRKHNWCEEWNRRLRLWMRGHGKAKYDASIYGRVPEEKWCVVSHEQCQRYHYEDSEASSS